MQQVRRLLTKQTRATIVSSLVSSVHEFGAATREFAFARLRNDENRRVTAERTPVCLLHCLSSGVCDGGSPKKSAAEYFAGIFEKGRGFCEKSNASSRLLARPSV